MKNLNWKLIAELVGGALFVVLVVWFFFFRSTSGLTPADTAQQQTFGQGETRTSPDTTSADASNQAQTIQSPVSKQKVFKITDGPVAGATFMQESRPTTTVARFVMQQNGHILDLPIDSPGAVAQAASNTTIPGIAHVVWESQVNAGRETVAGAVLQYIDNGTIKSVLLGFPSDTGTSTPSLPAPVRVQFLANDVRSIAASPDGQSIAYLATTGGGSDVYVARADGTSPKKLASLPLSQLNLSWPSQGTVFATSKAASGIAGITLSINASSGAVSPTLASPGLTATADHGFNYVIYQSASDAGRTTYVHTVKTGLDRPLSFSPMPEKCAWSKTQTGVMYCAVPLTYTQPNFIDGWYQGTASAADSIVMYNLITGKTTIVATPGDSDGGVASDIAQLAVSTNDTYLLFVTKGGRSVWGVRL